MPSPLTHPVSNNVDIQLLRAESNNRYFWITKDIQIFRKSMIDLFGEKACSRDDRPACIFVAPACQLASEMGGGGLTRRRRSS
jgi:hypothetical protein